MPAAASQRPLLARTCSARFRPAGLVQLRTGIPLRRRPPRRRPPTALAPITVVAAALLFLEEETGPRTPRCLSSLQPRPAMLSSTLTQAFPYHLSPGGS